MQFIINTLIINLFLVETSSQDLSHNDPDEAAFYNRNSLGFREPYCRKEWYAPNSFRYTSHSTVWMEEILHYIRYGKSVYFFVVWSFLLFGLFWLFGRGPGVHSLTRLPGSSLSDPTTKETEQQQKKHGFLLDTIYPLDPKPWELPNS